MSSAPAWLLEEAGFPVRLTAGADELPRYLAGAARWISGHAPADACAIYLLDDASGDLLLSAQHGLDASRVGSLRVAGGVGFVGRAGRRGRLQEVRLDDAAQRAALGTPGLDESAFAAALATPIDRFGVPVGVLVLYAARPRAYGRNDRQRLREYAVRLDVAVACLREPVREAAPREPPPQPLAAEPRRALGGLFRGQAVSHGYAMGSARVFSRMPAASILEHHRLTGAETPRVCELEDVLARTVAQLEAEQRALNERLPEAASLIFESHLMMLRDAFLANRIREGQEAGMDLGRAIAEAAAEFIRIFERSEHEYVREKGRDIEDLALRLLRNLDGPGGDGEEGGETPIIVARELLPSDILWIAQRNIRGIVLVSGGATAHVSLLVRSLGIPMVIVGASELLQMPDDTRVLVDGSGGIVLVDPPEAAVRSFEHRNRLALQAREERHAMREVTETLDGCRVRLYANINLLSEVEHALELRAEGVGLYRTELLYLIRQELPDEADQEAVYRRLLRHVGKLPVTFRTLDAGGDKVLSFFDSVSEANPALGLRSTRFTLKHPRIFDQQLRAILRASSEREDVRVMFPMIGSLDEWRQACRRFGDCAREIMETTGEGHHVRVGLMVELPAVVDLADAFAAEAAFFSIGTNDFIQYTLGVDRTNAQVSEYYCPHHPAVLRGLQRVVTAARRHGTPVSVCGEMAHDPRYIPFFVGIGVRELSVDPSYLPAVQAVVGRYTLSQAEHYALSLLKQTTIAEVEARLLGDADA